ncbi:MAG: SUMF1/EgtB/PvdO family nonheme iron enzyme, partial [Planctomycetota bacterium]|nr:SUMF1/EgtB/PvdO family nonheme iron enzyme [Planctomycetota bacterium]
MLAAPVHPKPGEKPEESDGFVLVPQGKVFPGTVYADIKDRAGGNQPRFQAMAFERWGAPESVVVPAFRIGRHEVTNAQWKYYFDKLYRKTHVTGDQDTLWSLAANYVSPAFAKHEWKSIYAFNMFTIAEALDKAGKWNAAWGDMMRLTQQGRAQAGLPSAFLPKGLKLTLYATRTPKHWYGWHEISGLNTGREYCDITKKPEEAFKLPSEDVLYKKLGLNPEEQVLPAGFRRSRARDYGSHPIRYLSAQQIMDFVEWAGCSLPSEYEWERTGRDERPRVVNAKKLLFNQHTFPGSWDRRVDVGAFAWVNNLLCGQGPLPVDHPGVAKGDGPFGTRHLLGNVYELTRTFFHYHPYLEQRPPPHPLSSVGLVAKGGSWGDGGHLIQLSIRTPVVGTADMDLASGHRVDSLGFRMTRHLQPAYDLLLHSILRTCFTPVRGSWRTDIYPHSFAMSRAGGVDATGIVKAKSPYIHVKDRAVAIAVVPLWMSKLSDREWGKERKSNGGGGGTYPLGLLRCDVPFYAGVELSPTEAKELEGKRKAYAEWEKKQKIKKKRRGRKKKNEEEEEEPPEKPSPPDEYEAAIGKKRAAMGIWRKKLIDPSKLAGGRGEWILAYWNGFIGLVNIKAGTIEAFLIPEGKNGFRKDRTGVQAAVVKIDPNTNRIKIAFATEHENPKPRKRGVRPPGVGEADLWALCETLDPKWTGWPKRPASKPVWAIALTIEAKAGAFESYEWNADALHS